MKQFFCNSFWNLEGASCRVDFADLQKEYQSVWKRGAVIVPCKFLRKEMRVEGAVPYLLFPLVWVSKLARSKTLWNYFCKHLSLSLSLSSKCVCMRACVLYWHGIEVRIVLTLHSVSQSPRSFREKNWNKILHNSLPQRSLSVKRKETKTAL